MILCFPLGHLSTFPRGEVFGAWPRSNPPLTCQTPGKQISYPLASLQGAENSWKVLLERWTPVVRVDLLRSEIWGHRTHLSWSLWSKAAKVLRMLSQAGLAKTQKKCTTLEAASFLVVLSFLPCLRKRWYLLVIPRFRRQREELTHQSTQNLSCEATTSPAFPWWMRFAVRILTMEIANMLLFDTEYLPGCKRCKGEDRSIRHSVLSCKLP